MQKAKVAIIFGGKSGEHEVSLVSASSIIENIDKSKYELYLIGITKEGHWRYYDGPIENIRDGSWQEESQAMVFPPDPQYKGFFLIEDPSKIFRPNLIFPVLHGPYGEDGTLQGLFELAHVPYVGCDVLSSALCMDKLMAKTIFSQEGLKQGKYLGFFRYEIREELNLVISRIEDALIYPVFVKPVNMGSSVGISKAADRQSLIEALNIALEHDEKIIVEEYIDGREIECAVLGNYGPQPSFLGEIIPSEEFYDYHAKYGKEGQSKLLIPAPLDEKTKKKIREAAIRAYRATGCSGLARVDFFLKKQTNDIYINEINTMPGFTQISMYPKLWEATGVSYSNLIDKLIKLALERFNNKHI